MFAAQHKLNNLMVIVDNNTRCMLGDTADVVGLAPLAEKFRAFGWSAQEVDGHDVGALCEVLARAQADAFSGPRVVIANTIKGKGVPALERDPLCHIRSLSKKDVEQLTGGVL